MFTQRPRFVTDTLAHRLREALGPDYALERELGGAGMSRVFVASERALGRRVVVKVLPPDLAAGVNIERFRREIQLAAQLQHPHVVPLLAAGERGELLWFTMPFIEGESLRVMLERRERLPAREVMRILHDVVDALAYAHARGVVHRDIKPGNILMSGAHAVVTDFGVAKALSAAIPLAGHTTSGMAIGTPAYMAPEQLAADPAADHRVDLYAVGLLAYELLTGTSPFTGASPQATLAAQLTVRPTPPHVARPDVPAGLSRLIMHCLEKDADRRPQTASALLAELEQVERQLSGEIAAASLARTRRNTLIGGALFVAATVVFAVTRPSGDAAPGAVVPDSLVAPAETVVVYRPLPIRNDDPTSITLPLVLSPAESSAIVQAYREQRTDAAQVAASGTGGAPPAVPTVDDVIDRDSLIAAVSRIFADSMARALASMEQALAASPRQLELQTLVRDEIGRRQPTPDSAGAIPRDSARVRSVSTVFVAPRVPPPPDGTRRLAILPFADRTASAAYATFGATLLDSIGAALRTVRGGRLEVIPADASRDLLGDTRLRATAAGFALRANYVLTGAYLVRNDSLVVVTSLTDVQGGAGTRYHQESAPLSASTAGLVPATATWVRARLDSMRRDLGTRRPPPNGDQRRQRQ
jgi:serine/threonine-protein kinase